MSEELVELSALARLCLIPIPPAFLWGRLAVIGIFAVFRPRRLRRAVVGAAGPRSMIKTAQEQMGRCLARPEIVRDAMGRALTAHPERAAVSEGAEA